MPSNTLVLVSANHTRFVKISISKQPPQAQLILFSIPHLIGPFWTLLMYLGSNRVKLEIMGMKSKSKEFWINLPV